MTPVTWTLPVALAIAWPALPLSGAAAPTGSPCEAAAVDDFYTIEADGALGGTVTENDTTCLFPVTLTAGPAHGVLAQLSPRGVFGYTPDPGFAGTDSFQYAIITDLDERTATVTIDVQACVPVAVDDFYTVVAGATLTADITDNDVTCGLGVDSVTGPAHGTGDGGPDGAFTFTPDPGFAGTDSFTYRLGSDASAETALVTIRYADGRVVKDGRSTPNSICSPGWLFSNHGED